MKTVEEKNIKNMRFLYDISKAILKKYIYHDH